MLVSKISIFMYMCISTLKSLCQLEQRRNNYTVSAIFLI